MDYSRFLMLDVMMVDKCCLIINVICIFEFNSIWLYGYYCDN